MPKYVLLTACDSNSCAVRLDSIRIIEICMLDGESGEETGWYLVVGTENDDFTSPSVPTRDDAIDLLRDILESDDALFDVGCAVDVRFGSWGTGA